MSVIRNNEIYVKLRAGGVDDSGGWDEEWDEACFGRVRQILLTHGDAINSIQFAYDWASVRTLGHRHGGDGDKFDCINLESYETPTQVRGFYGPTRGNNATVVRSLTIRTTIGTYGPFGREEGTPFSFNLPSAASFGGFHGRCNSSYLCAIGVYLKSTAKYHVLPKPLRYSVTPNLCIADESRK